MVTDMLGPMITQMFVTMGLAIPGAWTLMLLIGVVHHELVPALPPAGYGTAYPIALLLGWTLNWLDFTPKEAS